jgi:heme/copper-type cytochrome/quinol oxidase subunit 2
MMQNQPFVSDLVKSDMFMNIVVDFDSVMLTDEDLKEGMHRLLEVDNRLVLPVGVPIRFLITSTDVLHA